MTGDEIQRWAKKLNEELTREVEAGFQDLQNMRYLPPGEPVWHDRSQPWWRTLVADYNAWRSHR